MQRGVSSHPVLPHEGDDAGRRAGLGEEGVLEHLAGRGPLSRVPNQHPVQEALQQRRHLRKGGDGYWSHFKSMIRIQTAAFIYIDVHRKLSSVPCAGSSVWEANCPGSSSWL